MRPLYLLGRAIFGGFFLYNGVNLLAHEKAMSQYAASKGTPSPDAAVTTAGAMLTVGGASILAGVKPRHGLAAIIGFLIPVSLQMHRFWDEQSPDARTAELINFTKNMALVGAALMLLQLERPWPISVDEVRADGEEMFVRLGNRDLRALPA